MKQLYHTVNPHVRIKEGELLSKELFNQLIEAETFQRIGEILRPTVYGKYIKEQFEFDFEESLNQELQTVCQEMIELTPDSEIVWIYTMRFTFHNLKVLTKAQHINENHDVLCLPDGFYEIDELKRAIQTGNSEELPQNIMNSIDEVASYFEESAVLQGIDVIYDRHYLTEQRRVAESLGSPEFLAATIRYIDLTNIIIAARCLVQKRSQAFMTAVLSDAGSIEKEDFLVYANQSYADFKEFLLLSEYGNLLSSALGEKKIDFLALDLIKDNQLVTFFNQAKTTAFGPLPLLAYLNAKDIEIMNLRLIIVGKRSGFSKEQIKERMRAIDE